ncbi:MAG: glycoside hydrolase family 3 C-terminal domain-containing protein [Promethearchaeota archaeon]
MTQESKTSGLSEENIENKVNDLLKKLTLEEKFTLMAGHRFFQTRSIQRLGIKSFKMTDGPFGISMHSSFFRKNTRFPGGINLAATWNRQLAHEYGMAVGKEARAVGRLCVLSPGININRSPLNGRTFEYLSEDPYLTKELAIPYVKGVQSQRVAACPKHYVANNQETNRHTVSAEVSERALHEIYLRAFKEVIEEADPWTIMSSYNRVNSLYVNENPDLLDNTLMKKWGFSGFVMTDWWATSKGMRKPQEDPVILTEIAIKSGLSLEMPMPYIYDKERLLNAYNSGKFTDEALDEVIRRLLRVLVLVGMFEDEKSLPKGERNTSAHQRLARQMAEEGMVLLKNANNILPLEMSKITKIAVLGPNHDIKFGRWLYGGSSAVKPPYEITALKGLQEKCKGKVNIVHDPQEADYVLLFMGLNHDSNINLLASQKTGEITYGNDCEGTDRQNLALSKDQIDLINETAKVNPKTIVVLINGSPIAMDGWIENVPAVLEAWYPGMEGGKAIANVLFGDVNPSGKLPITFPRKITDSPAHKSSRTFPGEDLVVHYDEGIFVGYRHFDKENIEPLFPFGYGLSYTTFTYEDINLDKNVLKSIDDTLVVSVKITNTGSKTGSEIIQIYAEDMECSVERPPKELIGFSKVNLKPNETKNVKINVKAKDLAFYDISTHSWKVEPGNFDILIGSSSRDIHLKKAITYQP